MDVSRLANRLWAEISSLYTADEVTELGLYDFRAANLAPKRSFVDVAAVGHYVSRNVRLARHPDRRRTAIRTGRAINRSRKPYGFSSLSPCVHKGPCVRVDCCGEVPEVERICGKPYAGLRFLSGER
jgi:hypothetical protein